jgi:hypothetical protein
LGGAFLEHALEVDVVALLERRIMGGLCDCRDRDKDSKT